MAIDQERLWQAIAAGDGRFDGWVFCGVTSTGIYCRPSCPARTPRRENVRFFPSAAAAQLAGFRACKRCRPDATPGSPEWDRRGDLVGRAMRLVADGVVDREGVTGLASRLGYSERHVHRELVAVAGAGPLALARAQRAQLARVLLERTALSATEVAFAAGFRSLRQFNATIRNVFDMTPTQLRAGLRRGARQARAGGAISLRLPFRAPLDGARLVRFFSLRALAGVEEVDGERYRRSMGLPHGNGVVELQPRAEFVRARFWLEDPRDLAAAMQRSRRLLDLDSDPAAVTAALGAAPVVGPVARAMPGLRLPGHADGAEVALRAVLAQQVSLRGGIALARRLVELCGSRLEGGLGGLDSLFPHPAAVAAAPLERLPLPATRRSALRALARALSDGRLSLDAGADRERARSVLLSLPGIGPWTAEYVALRALRDPDAFPHGDVGVRRALEALGSDGSARAALQLAERWRPYRAYATAHLWAHLDELRARAPCRDSVTAPAPCDSVTAPTRSADAALAA